MISDDHYPLEIANKVTHFDFINLRHMFIANGLLYAPSYLIFGVHYQSGFYTMILLSTASLFLLFLFSYLLTKNYWAALLATTFMAFNFSFVQFSLSTYNHVPTFFFIMLTLFSFFLYLKIDHKPLLYLSLSSLLYLIFIRVEMIFFIPFLLFLFFRTKKTKLKQLKNWIPWIIFSFVFLLGFPKHLSFYSNLDNLSNIRMNFSNFYGNVTEHLIENLGIDYYILFLLMVGFFYIIIRKNHDMALVFGSSIFYWVFYLFLSYEHISNGRHFFYVISVWYIISAFGMISLIKLFLGRKLESLACILIFLFIFGFFFNENVKICNYLKNSEIVNKMYFDSRVPTYLNKVISNQCIVLSPHPAKFGALTDLKSFYVGHFNQKIKHGECVIFVEDFSCEYPEQNAEEICERFMKKYNLTVYGYIDSTIIEVPLKTLTINYTIYRVLPS